jgi:hypothetical protein
MRGGSAGLAGCLGALGHLVGSGFSDPDSFLDLEVGDGGVLPLAVVVVAGVVDLVVLRPPPPLERSDLPDALHFPLPRNAALGPTALVLQLKLQVDDGLLGPTPFHFGLDGLVAEKPA